MAPARARATPLRLKRGVNAFPWFQLTQEYPAPRTDYAWPPFQPTRPVPTARDLARLHDVGLDFLRLPVDPGPFLAAPAAQRRALLDQLTAAVRLCLDHGLSVVVNVQANGGTHYWTPARHDRLDPCAGVRRLSRTRRRDRRPAAGLWRRVGADQRTHRRLRRARDGRGPRGAARRGAQGGAGSDARRVGRLRQPDPGACRLRSRIGRALRADPLHLPLL